MLTGFLCWLWLVSGGLQPGSAQDATHPSAVDQQELRVPSPMHQRVSETVHALQERFELIDIDTLFYIENRGLTRILVNLNGHPFKLVVDPAEVRRSANAFLIPEFGEITLNIAAYIRPGEDNFMEVASQGPEGASAELIIGDLFVPGQEVAYAIENLMELPDAFGLLQSYPNPFSDRTRITYEIPQNRTSGLRVSLVLYDVLGRQTRVLVDEERYPGTFSVVWDGRADHGRLAAGGVYFCLMVAGEVRETIRLVLTR